MKSLEIIFLQIFSRLTVKERNLRKGRRYEMHMSRGSLVRNEATETSSSTSTTNL